MGVTVTSKMIFTMERGLSMIIERGLTYKKSKQKDKILKGLGRWRWLGGRAPSLKKEVHIKKSMLTHHDGKMRR